MRYENPPSSPAFFFFFAFYFILRREVPLQKTQYFLRNSSYATRAACKTSSNCTLGG
ncbi:hypothetical protein K450DRAFT_228744 [Umbelopsis ramanniana AG]|uniref:Uncharacterized protein n=1 Tax=Umbelopsis ramanniana AG TaxID=1314678 RepID=A0AAD5EFL5_UMBRA|nr:uncharacterized protein K450DRAFT_228744 [Umbelopsis ramanniana AG]KAI8582041.1 hypothetical protein K450DRAFT_228744 [Umbelopsis ramanniana AG]